MRWLYFPLWTLYRIWFYILMGGYILVMFPFLFISILSESFYPFFFLLARGWAWFVLTGMGFRVKKWVQQPLDPHRSYMLIANHTSMTDVMLMLVLVKNPFVFVGKKELADIPLFGFFYKRTCILVDRNNPKSRHAVYQRAQKRLQSGLSICIFPEGGVPDESVLLDHFKDGAFRLAIEHQIPIVPMTFADNKKLFSYTFFSGHPGLMRAYIHPQLRTEGLALEDKKSIKQQAYQVIFNQLMQLQSED